MTAAQKAPFPYFGGKSRIAGLVWERFGAVDNYVEPFFGSGAVLLGCPHPGHTETVNDADGLLANFWRALQFDPDAVAFHADWPVNECVPAGTMIATPAGDVPVEQVVPGMLVWGERGGRIVATRVTATKRSKATEFYDIGPLRVTGNHPIWTAEQGYQEARLLATGMHIAMLNSPVDELDLVMLQYPHERTAVGNLHTDRPAHRSGAVCRRDVSWQETIQRASVARRDGRQDTPRLLDTLPGRIGLASYLSGDRTGARRRLARSRTALDSTLSANLQSGQSYRWRRWDARLYPYAGAASEVVGNARWCALSTGSHSRHEGQAPHAGGPRENQRGWGRPPAYPSFAREAIEGSQGQGTISRAYRENGGRETGRAAYSRAQCEDRRINYESQAGDLCRDWRDIPLNNCCGAQPGGNRSIGQPGDSQGLPLQRESLPVPVAVYNFQTEAHNYFANRILVHNCDLHARHHWLVDHRSMVEELMSDPEWYDPKAAGWWVWGISQWIGTGWCPSYKEPSEQKPLLRAPNYGTGTGQIGVHADRLARKRPAIGGRGHPSSVGGMHGKLHKIMTRDGQFWRKRPSVENNGVHRKELDRKMPFIASPSPDRKQCGTGAPDRGIQIHDEPSALYDYFRALAARLRRVRVVCGDFTRILGPSVTWRHGMTAVFLDPPYADAEHAIQYSGGGNVWERMTTWCEANGDHPLLRIALCGYAGTWEPPAGWEAVQWRTSGGYGSQGNGRGRENAAREVVWFSPACLNPTELARDALTRPLIVNDSDWSGTLFEEEL